ncbi:hypothetical protein G7Y89_g14453 [Cudoniella acicularis]|uniref:DUF6594 domain-containing protein n=1 Tax=Cudoniella acicularis TaxID=354080 RepID=A0A8H4R542_9HELO|nr:hypothetical protein G7Y89_g14453 [Cudoniella acicularis]
MNSQDIELSSGEGHPPNGFPSVAAKIASDIDKTTTIYRRFDRLSARNILLLQAEIAELEYEQDRYDAEDRKRGCDDVAMDSQSDWREFVRNSAAKDRYGKLLHPREREKMELSMKIRSKLKEYHETLAAHRDLLNATPPSPSTVKALRNWFFNNTSGRKTENEETPQLWGASVGTYDDIHDLVALRVPADQDRLSTFIQNNLGVLFQTRASDGHTTYISERSVSHFVAILSTVLAAIMLFGAIISLYIVKNQQALLGMLSGWTVLFAACVGLLTNAKRDQIFGATAAYAAVLVVFVSGNLGGASSTGNCICTPG